MNEPSRRKPIVLGVAGGSASGKSTVVQTIVKTIGAHRCASIPHDAYYHDLSHMPLADRAAVNVDHPDSLETDLLVRHVGALLAGQSIEVPRYDFVSQTRSSPGPIIEPAPLLIVEGLLVFVDSRLRSLMDLKVFVDASEEDRLARRIERDGRERGRDRVAVVRQHEAIVQPMHDEFVEPTRVLADVVIAHGGQNVQAIQRLTQRVEALLHSR